jgi:hypothetical protein
MKTHSATVLSLLFTLPHVIKYEGFIFTLQVWSEQSNMYVGYKLQGVQSKEKDKLKAFQMGFWHVNKVSLDSVNSDFLRKVLIDKLCDTELYWALDELYSSLLKDRILVQTDTLGDEISENETTYTEILNPYLM